MTFSYKTVVPWGRNYDEYVRMFALSEDDLRSRIAGCGDGPASFNAECNRRGGRVVSIDPIYAFSREEITLRIDETCVDVLAQTERNRDKFRWDRIATVEDLHRVRMAAMGTFLENYEEGKRAGVYIPASLPELPFDDDTFDLALCSHMLFLHSDHLSLPFHIAAIREMLRVAAEVRIFPLLDVNGLLSSHLDGVLAEFQHLRPEIRQVEYEFQINGNEMLSISRRSGRTQGFGCRRSAGMVVLSGNYDARRTG